MAQAGLHALVGMAVRKGGKNKEWLLLGILLGSLFPDMDNILVAVATLMKTSTEGIHRTATHSIIFAVAVTLVFWLVGAVRKDIRWKNLGFGLGVGIILHILLDLILWFNGVNILWPLGGWVNLWAGYSPPEWFMKFMDPLEFLFFAIYLWGLGAWSLKAGTDGETRKTHRAWLIFELVLFALFTPLAYIMTRGFLTLFGAFYLLSLIMAFFLTIRMRRTVEAAASPA
jgi:membrane-bound metal-dependent hydrolase YbcI (DUF457 family)